MPQAANSRSAETRLDGDALAPGVALGRPCYYASRPARPDSTEPPDSTHEIRRLRSALQRLAQQRAELARETAAMLGPEPAEIFHAHSLMLADKTLRAELEHGIQVRGYSAGQTVQEVLARYQAKLSESDVAYLQQRAADIGEIQHALLADLNRSVACRHCRGTRDCGIEHCRLGNDHILITSEFSASLPIETDSHTTGFIVGKAGPNCHAVILARALRRPVVANLGSPAASIVPQAQLLVDGDQGVVIVNPAEDTLAAYREMLLTGDSHNLRLSPPVRGLKVMANISLSADVGDALAAGAEGVGLYRTEMELLAAGRLLSEDEQALRYSQVVKAMSGRPVCIRLLDLHQDKDADWLQTPPAAPATAGERDAHCLLALPQLLRAQARALARASVHGPIHVLYPMIASAEQFLELRGRFAEAVSGLPVTGLQHGVLFEVPAACLAAAQIMKEADFGCIGTNDLIQYLFGIDRAATGNHAHRSIETGSVLWELIATLSRTAAGEGKPLAICGELAGNPELTARIMGCGITAISTSPARVANVRRAAERHLRSAV